MSAFDAFFNKGFFRAAKCKTLLKLTIPRIKLLRNRREMQLKQMRKEIAKLLETGQEATARIRVEHIIREENMMAAQEILELFCELITVRLPIIESQRECPLDLKEAISSICFAAPRCADLPELQQVQMLLAAKYGREFVAAATELMPECGVNRQIIELLSIRAPAVEEKIKLLKEIAEEHDVDWNIAAYESEFLKLHEDLLNGPSAFTSEPTMLSQEKYSESLLSQGNPVHDGPDDEPDRRSESLDLPEVPKASVLPTPSIINSSNLSTTTSATDVIPSFPTVPPSDSASTSTLDGVSPPSFTVDVKEQPKKSLPFVSSLPSSVIPPLIGHHEAAASFSIPSASPSPSSIISFPQVKAEIAYNKNLTHTIPAAQETAGTAECSIPWFSIPSQSQTSSAIPSLSHVETEAQTNDGDLNDVLAAAQAAAETAEHAASAARAAASLALIRITELTTKKNGKLLNMGGVGDLKNNSSDGSEEMIDGHHLPQKHMLPASMHEVPNLEAESPFSPSYQFNNQPSHSPSLEDDPYFSYPDLFSRQNSE